MKNICFIINSLVGGGAERVVITLATALAKRGHRVEIIMLFDDTIDYPVDQSLFKIHYVGLKTTNPFIVKVQGKLLRIRQLGSKLLVNKISELGIDFDLFVSSLSSADILCINSKLPNLHCCIHRVISEENKIRVRRYKEKSILKEIFVFLIRRVFNRTVAGARKHYKNQNLIAVSKGVESDVLALGIKSKHIQTIYNPFDFDSIRSQAEAYPIEEKEYIIFVGRIYETKCIDLLIEAYQRANIDQKLLIFGKGPLLATITDLITSLGLQEKVILKGFKSNPYPYIKNAKALILSSETEALPTVLIEALILGTPVISTDCSFDPNEILIDELADFLSPVGDVEALANNIKKMIDSPVKITEKYICKFEAKKIAEQYLSLCK